MTGNVSQRDMRVQRAIEADARLRELPKKSANWPDPRAPKRPRTALKAIHVTNPETARLVDSPKVQEAAAAE